VAEEQNFLEFNQEQASVLDSPVRQSLLQVISASGPLSVAELAFELDRPEKGLYHHLRLLEGAGFIRVHSQRKGKRRIEALYEISGKSYRFPPTDPEGATRASVAQSIGRHATNSYVRVVSSPELVDAEILELAAMWHGVFRLDVKTARKLRRKLMDVFSWAKEQQKREAPVKVTATAFLAPVVQRKHQKRANGSEEEE
jgi:hypothetical protein